MSLLPSRPDAEPSADAGPRVIGLEDDAADEVLAALSSGTARSLLAALHDDPAPPSELADRCDTSLQNVQYHLEKLENAGAVEVVETAYSEKGREMDVYAPADQPLVVFAGDEDDGSTLRTAIRRLLGAVGVLGLASLFIQAMIGRLPFGFGAAGPTGDGDGGGGSDVVFQTEEDIERAPSGGDASTTDGAATETPDPGGDGGPPGTPADADTPVPEATGTPAQDTPMPEATDTPDAMPTEDAHDLATDVVTTAADGADGAVAGAGLPPGLVFFAGGLFVLAVVGVVWYVNQR